MDRTFHSLDELFRQLGLPDDPSAMDAFVRKRRPLPRGASIGDAPFWTVSQAQFLREKIADDADWAAVVDALGALLSHPAPARH